MAELTIPNSFDNGDVISASEMNANFNAIKTLVNTTRLGLDNINHDHHLVNYSFYHDGSVSAGDSIIFRFSTFCPTGVLVAKQLSHSALFSGATITVQVYKAPSSLSAPTDNGIMDSASTSTTTATPTVVTAFNSAGTSIASGTAMAIKVSASDAAISEVSVVLTFVAQHVDTD